MRVGMGYDVHKLVENRKLILGGDVIIVKEGTYKFSDTIVINNAMNGKSGSYIIVKAESGKEVKFDFSAQKLDGANRGVVVDGDYWYFQGINFYGAGDNGVLLAGNNNIFEKCVFEARSEEHTSELQSR